MANLSFKRLRYNVVIVYDFTEQTTNTLIRTKRQNTLYYKHNINVQFNTARFSSRLYTEEIN